MDVSSACEDTGHAIDIPFGCRTIFSRRIMDSLNPNANYEELVSVRLVGMMLVIVVREELRKNVVRYSIQTVGTGALNFMVIIIV